MKTIAVYPGSFDPPTYGHLDIIDRSSRVFSRVIVAVARNLRKDPMFTLEEREGMLKKLTADYPNVEVDSFQGLLVDYAKRRGAHVLLRGLRAVSDFEYEMQVAHMNKKLAADLDTVFMMTGEGHAYISSNIVKEIARFGGSIDPLVPPLVREMVRSKIRYAGNP
jgi:pantetheine-phosphate adenylyltransferase